MPIPGRYFVYYWNSSDHVRRYAREACGVPALPGSCSRVWEEDGGLVSNLVVDGQTVIKATAQTTDDHLTTLGGH